MRSPRPRPNPALSNLVEEGGRTRAYPPPPLPLVRHLQDCEAWRWLDPPYCETRFPDGTRVPAAPQDTDAYRAQAAACGYGTDTARLSWEHELSHSLLAEAAGLPHSPALWAVAHGLPLRGIWREENMVLAFQRWATATDVLTAAGWTVPALALVWAQLRERG